MKRASEQVPGPHRAHLLVVSQERAAFEEALRGAGARMRLKYFAGALEAMAAALVVESAPVLLFVDGPLIFRQEAGAMRLLDQAPGPIHQVVLLPPGMPESEGLEALLQGTRVRFMAVPAGGAQILEVVEALLGPLHPWEELGAPMADLVRGVADALNNPLAGLSGFLQLLELQLGASADPSVAATLAQLRKSLAGLARVMEDLEIAGAARSFLPARIDLVSLAREACARRPPGTLLELAPAPQSLPIQGDPTLVAAALDALLLLAEAVAAKGVRFRVGAREAGGGAEILIVVPSVLPSRWRADRTFHPFFLSRALQAPEIGLAPAVAAGAARSLGGRAEARWGPEGALHLSLVLP